LLLLPTETGVGGLTLRQLHAQIERWLKPRLNLETPEQMLELDRANPGQVLIPA